MEVTDASTPTPETATATFSISVAAPPINQDLNWSGYVYVNSSVIYDVSGEWTVPTLDCGATPNATASIWAGAGGDGPGTGALLQTGVLTMCTNGVQENAGWWEELPSDPNHPNPFDNFPVAAGDVIDASVYQTTTGAWETRVNDLSTGLSGIMITGEGWGVYQDGSDSSFPEQGSTAGLSYSGGTSAEWIVEDPGATPAPFANYTTVSFSDLETSMSSWTLTPDDAWEIVQNGVVLSTPSMPSITGFTVTYTG